jgi:hypothetical protein
VFLLVLLAAAVVPVARRLVHAKKSNQLGHHGLLPAVPPLLLVVVVLVWWLLVDEDFCRYDDCCWYWAPSPAAECFLLSWSALAVVGCWRRCWEWCADGMSPLGRQASNNQRRERYVRKEGVR